MDKPYAESFQMNDHKKVLKTKVSVKSPLPNIDKHKPTMSQHRRIMSQF